VADNVEIAWLAGLLEGEGCFSAYTRLRYGNPPSGRVYSRVLIQLAMTDEFPVAKAAEIMGVSHVTCVRRTTCGKLIYRTNVYGPNAIRWMREIYSFMSPRRQAKINECVRVWENMPTQLRRQKVLEVA